jgi:hypothetical protein
MNTEISGANTQTDILSAAFGNSASNVLDMRTWPEGGDLASFYDLTRAEVAEAVDQERRTRGPIRNLMFSVLAKGQPPFVPPGAGLYRIEERQLLDVQKGLLFNGGTESCDGTRDAHDSLILSVIQIGVALVAYQGSHGTWVQRLYRRDLRANISDPIAEAEAILQRRGQPDPRDSETGEPMTRLVRRALMEYAERAALTDLSKALWRMGHGNPIPTSLLMATSPELVAASMDVLGRLLLDHKRFVFVPSDPADTLLLTLGNALEEREFAIVSTMAEQFSNERLHRLAETQRGHPKASRAIQEFLKQARFELVTGIYRASAYGPPRLFYAHKDFACEAAALAMADSLLQPVRGFPMLIDLADIVCRHVFDGAGMRVGVQHAYASCGEPARFLGERETRDR